MATFGQTSKSQEWGPGVPRDLARWRSEHYSKVSYNLSLELTSGSDVLRGTEEIRITLDARADRLVLDWRVNAAATGKPKANISEIMINGADAPDVQITNDHIIFAGKQVRKGENIVRLKFESPISTSGSAVTRYLDREDKSEYLYTLFVPSDASTAFPCFDQPDLKGRFTLSVDAPQDWTVVTNTALVGQSDVTTGQKHFSFAQTEPISTYLFAFAAGPFTIYDAPENTTPMMRIFVRKSRAERARKELSELFRIEGACLNYLSEYFGYKFPFSKYDMVLVPEFAYGGMEHAGATFLREEAILFPTDPTANDFISRADLMFHETAHQWFGDLVTMRWFDDLWLKEGFAEFMAFKTMDAVMPEYKAWKVFYQRIKPAAYLTDATKGTTPVFQEIPNLSAAKSAYGNIVYRKAPSMLRQAEVFLGPEEFRKALRMYLKQHAYGNAEWSDLVGAFEQSSGRKLKEWAAAWVKTRGMPDVRVSWSVGADHKIERLELRQTDVLNEGGSWPMRVQVLLVYPGRAKPDVIAVTMKGSGETPVPEAVGKLEPSLVFANFEDYGYGRFLLDDKSRQFALENLSTIKDDFLRTLLWGTLWDSVREAELDPDQYLELVIQLAHSETDEVTVQSLLGRMSTAFNRYLSDSQARGIAPRLESLLANQMVKAPTAGLRITYFRAFQSVASTEAGLGRLKSLLSGELKVPGMTLRSRDRFDIITALLARNDGEAPALLKAESERAQTDDDKRYAYAAAAAREDPAVKKAYFDAYQTDTKLPESWIEASLGPFNSIHQSNLTQPYLAPALRELPRLKRIRKIFFINNWLAAFIGGQCDQQALSTVKEFLDQQPSLDRDLRLKVLESSDGLERCVRIREKFAK